MYIFSKTSSDRPERVFERKREATRKTFLENCREVPRGRTVCSPEAHAARGRRCLVAGGFVVSLPCCDPTRARVGRDFGPERRHKEPQTPHKRPERAHPTTVNRPYESVTETTRLDAVLVERQGTLGIARLWVGGAASPEVWKRVASRARENAYVFLPV